MDNLAVFLIGFVTGVFRKDIFELIKKFGIWLTTPAAKKEEKK